MLKSVPSCECGKCTCNISGQVTKFVENDFVIKFLKGLSEEFEAVKSQILLMSPLPDVNSAFALAVKFERKVTYGGQTGFNNNQNAVLNVGASRYGGNPQGSFNSKSQRTSQNSGGFKQRGGFGGGKKGGVNPQRYGTDNNKRPICTHCGFTGHVIERCYKLHGYPPGYKPKGQVNCVDYGDGCESQTEVERSNTDGKGQQMSNAMTSPMLTLDQYNQLMSMLQDHQVNGQKERSVFMSVGDREHAVMSAQQQGTNGKLAGNVSSKCVNVWVLDSGDTDHISCSLSLFDSYQSVSNLKVKLPDGSCVNVTHTGTISLSPFLVLNDVFYIPSFSFNLISLSKLTSASGINVFFYDDCCVLYEQKNMMMIGSARANQGLYKLIIAKKPHPLAITSIPSPFISSLSSNHHNAEALRCSLWHFRLGHMSHSRIKDVCKLDPTVSCSKFPIPCNTCPLAKQRRNPFPISLTSTSSVFSLVHVRGPYSTPTMFNERFFLTIVDDHSRFCWIFLMKHKSETKSILQNFCTYAAVQFDTNIKVIRSDNGLEFKMPLFYASKGIIHQTSCVYTPQQNGLVERKQQHIMCVARALKIHANMPTRYWGFCVMHAVYLINLSPSPTINHKTPHELLYCKAPNYHNLRVFGCQAFALDNNPHKAKFSARSKRCVFLGMSTTTKGYVLQDIESKTILISRDVQFQEDTFPFNNASNSMFSQPPVETSIPCHDPALSQTQCPYTYDLNPIPASHPLNSPNAIANTPIPPCESSDPCPGEPPEQSQSSPLYPLQSQPASTTECCVPISSDSRSIRTRKAPAYLQDYYCNQYHSLTNHHTSPHHLSNSYSLDSLAPGYKTYVLNTSLHTKPSSYLEAASSSAWQEAMHTEIAALEANQTWDMVPLPAGKHPIGCRWVYKVKYKPDGSVERYKARLVAKGYTQQYGVDYQETFSPVAKMTTVRVVLALAASKGWLLHQLDVNNAFLHGDLREEIYMTPPPGIQLSGPNLVCRLRKSLYGLKQASREWNSKLTNFLLASGFVQSKTDYTLFEKVTPAYRLILLVYVDDIVLACSDIAPIQHIKSQLNTQFRIKDLGDLRYFLGIEVARSQGGC